ncbi:hypothetical protein MZV40_24410, partial [Escherichia coli]|uniref:hypothetical protein n=2 Tax=Escherichia coli TaxID=562 RepID=UPI003458540F
ASSAAKYCTGWWGILYRLVGQGKKLFRWRLPEGNPYLRTETRNTYTSRFTEVAMAFASI